MPLVGLITPRFSAANLPKDCINLGQGYMNFGPPEWVQKAADDALATVPGNHYSHPKGRIRLREAIRDFYSADFKRTLNVDTEIIVTSGANEGILVTLLPFVFSHLPMTGQYAIFVAFLEPGDEVIMFEPFFDQWLPSITFNHGVPVYVPLHPPPPGQAKSTSDDWTIDFDELRRAVTPKTKMIIVNTPHNPVGKVFTQQELEGIAAVAEEHNLLVMADEVVSTSRHVVLWYSPIGDYSMRTSSSTTNRISDFATSQECGTAQSPSSQQESPSHAQAGVSAT